MADFWLEQYYKDTGARKLGSAYCVKLTNIKRYKRCKIYREWKDLGIWFKVVLCPDYKVLEEVNKPENVPTFPWGESTKAIIQWRLATARDSRLIGNIDVAMRHENYIDHIYKFTTDQKTKDYIEELEGEI